MFIVYTTENNIINHTNKRRHSVLLLGRRGAQTKSWLSLIVWTERSLDVHICPRLWRQRAGIHFGWKAMIHRDWIASVWPGVLFPWECSLMRQRSYPPNMQTQLNPLPSCIPTQPSHPTVTRTPRCRCLQQRLFISHRVPIQPALTFPFIVESKYVGIIQTRREELAPGEASWYQRLKSDHSIILRREH